MPAHRHGVLLVEDHDDTREAFSVVVSATHLDVTACATGAEALAHLRRDPHHWCLVLTDWWLPDMNGEELLRAQQADPRIARVSVAVVTGDAQVRDAAGDLGVKYFFLKPVDFDVLVALLADHCRMPAATGTDRA
jgi:DNA-binding NtrC family response regulator